MLVEKLFLGENSECYTCSRTVAQLEHLRENIEIFLSQSLAPLRQWLDIDPKVVKDMGEFIFECVRTKKSWYMGGMSLAVLNFPAFHLLPQENRPSSLFEHYGILDFTGQEIWIPIDGYHRLHAIKYALDRLAVLGLDTVLLEDSIPVTLIPLKSFNDASDLLLRMHKSARFVERGEALRTATGDIYAIYTRRLMGDDPAYTAPFKSEWINWKTNTLTNRLPKFSTLSVLYDSAKTLDQTLHDVGMSENQRYEHIAEIWQLLLTRFTRFKEALHSLNFISAQRDQYLCLRPTGQLAIIHTLTLATKVNMPFEMAIERLNSIKWEINNPLWEGIIIINGRVNGSTSAILLTARLLAHLIGIDLSDEILELTSRYRSVKKQADAKLPEPLYAIWKPE
jgi:DNA-sulfur modification-associated